MNIRILKETLDKYDQQRTAKKNIKFISLNTAVYIFYITREYFWTKNNLFSKLLKVNLLFKKITKNDYLILTK